MPQAAVIRRSGPPAQQQEAVLPAADPAGGEFGSPVPYDRPLRWQRGTNWSPVTNAKLPNQQEMQSGADEVHGVHDSNRSGADYSREQGVGRAPGWQWPFNFHSEAFNFNSLDKWNAERSGLGEEPPGSGINPYYGVPEHPYSPIAAMDQYTMFYENDPGERYEWPEPVIIPDAHAPTFSELAVLG